MSRTYLRGDLYYADLGHGIGSEQKGTRPVVIIQNNVGNKHSPTVIIAAITSKANIKAKLPTHYYLDAGNGLAQPSLVLLEQIRTIPYFDVYDPRFLDFGVPVAVRGTISFQINDYREFIKLNRLQNFSLDDFQKQIRDTIVRYVKDAVVNTPAAHNIPVVQLESKTSQINDTIEYDIKERLKENFGVVVTGVDISAIEIDKFSEGYHQLMAVTKNVAATKVEAETQDYVEHLRIQREEGQYAQHKQAQTANLGAFQTEKQVELGIAGAEALGHMGDNGAGSVNLGSGGAGFNPAAMMAGMAVGGVVGQNIAGTMNSMMAGINQPIQTGTMPPPIPTAIYHVAVNGQATGPYDMNALAQMASAGQFNAGSLVWKAGMPQWEKAGTVDELKNLFSAMPPIPTSGE